MEAVTDAFRLELRQWNIHVALVDPGGSKSAIFGKTIDAIDAMAQGLHERGIHLYDDDIASVRALVEKTADEADVARPRREGGGRTHSPRRSRRRATSRGRTRGRSR